MYSHLRQGAFGSIFNLGARRYNNRGPTKFSPFKAPSSPRNFQSFVQRQGQAGLAEYSRYHEQALEYENTEELTRSQSPVYQVQSTTSSYPSPFTSIPDVASKTPKSAIGETTAQEKVVPLYYQGSKFDKEPYWQKIGRWKDVTEEQFLSHRWNVSPTSSTISIDNAKQQH